MNADNDSKSRSGRRVAFWMMSVILSAILPVLAQIPLLSRFATVLWLASMPLCVLGCAMTAKEIAAHRATGQARDCVTDRHRRTAPPTNPGGGG